MKLKTKVSNLTHDDLVDLISTATYGSNWLSVRFNKRAFIEKGLEIEDDDSIEDVCAKSLLNGLEIQFLDFEASDPSDYHGKKAHYWDDDIAAMAYYISLKDIENGLGKAFDSKYPYIRQAAHFFSTHESGSFDIHEADILAQVIIFGDVIFG